MINADSLRVYLAIKKREARSQMEDTLVLDGFNVRTFATAADLWDAFQQTRARIVITERRFDGEFTGLDLARRIRKRHMLPYVYVVVLSAMNRLKEIKEALAVGVDDYLIKPPNRFQLRSRVLVGMRWLDYVDSLYEAKSEKSESDVSQRTKG